MSGANCDQQGCDIDHAAEVMAASVEQGKGDDKLSPVQAVQEMARCGACLRLLNRPQGSILHMQGSGGRVVCGEKAVQVWAVVSVDDALRLQERIAELEAALAAEPHAEDDDATRG